MQKAFRRIPAVLGRVVFIGLSIQIVLGIVWMCLNFPNLQEFGESVFYVRVSKNFICDEYTGILYPVFLLLARGVEKLIRLPYYCVLYAVQLLIACYAAHRLLFRLGLTRRILNLWGSLGMLTLPMAMQCHLAVLPYSFAGSFFLLEISFALDMILWEEAVSAKQLMRILPFWVLCALLLPEYLYIGAIPVAIASFWRLALTFFRSGGPDRGALRRIVMHAILIVSFLGMILGMNGLTQVKGYYGKVHKSTEFFSVSRFAWSSLMDTYEEWPEEMQNAVDRNKLMESAFYPDNLFTVFGPLVEEAAGQEKAREFFRELSQMAWENNRRAILHEIAWDAASYTVSPIALQMQLTGRGYDSFSGRNYEIMRHHTPVLSRVYMDYSCWWFGAGLVLSLALSVLHLASGASRTAAKGMKGGLLAFFSCTGLVLLYTMRGAGMMDYKNTIAVNCLWVLWSVLAMAEGMEQEEQVEK